MSAVSSGAYDGTVQGCVLVKLINMKSKIVIGLISVCLLSACQESSSNSSTPAASGVGSNTRSDCGIVIDQKLHNPPAIDKGISGRIIDGIDGEYIAFQPDEAGMGPILVKSLAASSTNRSDADNTVKGLAGSGSVVLFKAGDGCSVYVADGARGILGTVMLRDGRVLTEELLSRGYLKVDRSRRDCSANLVENCYAALAESAPTPAPASPPESPPSGSSPGGSAPASPSSPAPPGSPANPGNSSCSPLPNTFIYKTIGSTHFSDVRRHTMGLILRRGAPGPFPSCITVKDTRGNVVAQMGAYHPTGSEWAARYYAGWGCGTSTAIGGEAAGRIARQNTGNTRIIFDFGSRCYGPIDATRCINSSQC